MVQSTASDDEWPFPMELLHPMEGKKITRRYNFKKNTKLPSIVERLVRDFSQVGYFIFHP